MVFGPRQIPLRSALAAALVAAVLLVAGGCASRTTPPDTIPVGVSPRSATAKAASVIRTARSLIGAPYKWGGDSPRTGFDCSGFIWFTYRQNGVPLPRVTWQQFGVGTAIRYSDIRPGDLIFHKVEKKGKSLHVGIVTDRGTFIHAPSSGKRVMESSLNNIFWREHYIGARRVL